MEYVDEEAVLIHDLDCAIVGWGGQPTQSMLVVYCYKKLVEHFMEHGENWNYTDSVEYVDYNIAGAYLGKKTYIILHECSCEDCNATSND